MHYQDKTVVSVPTLCSIRAATLQHFRDGAKPDTSRRTAGLQIEDINTRHSHIAIDGFRTQKLNR